MAISALFVALWIEFWNLKGRIAEGHRVLSAVVSCGEFHPLGVGSADDDEKGS